MKTGEEIIKECRNNFDKHELTIIHESISVKRYLFRDPKTWCFGFYLTCADNLIVMNGDTYSLLVEPGYGRDGLAFLRGAIDSYDYFLSKCPLKMEVKEYSHSYAMELLKEDVENEYISQEQLDDAYGLDEGEFRGEIAYWDFCYEHNLDDPCSPRTYTRTTLNQIAGLRCFIDKYDK